MLIRANASMSEASERLRVQLQQQSTASLAAIESSVSQTNLRGSLASERASHTSSSVSLFKGDGNLLDARGNSLKSCSSGLLWILEDDQACSDISRIIASFNLGAQFLQVFVSADSKRLSHPLTSVIAWQRNIEFGTRYLRRLLTSASGHARCAYTVNTELEFTFLHIRSGVCCWRELGKGVAISSPSCTD